MSSGDQPSKYYSDAIYVAFGAKIVLDLNDILVKHARGEFPSDVISVPTKDEEGITSYWKNGETFLRVWTQRWIQDEDLPIKAELTLVDVISIDDYQEVVRVLEKPAGQNRRDNGGAASGEQSSA